jgi:Glycosyl hydrolases family 2, TIM barrel domain
MRFVFICLLMSMITYSQTTVEKANDKWVLKVNGEPFIVKGMTFGYDADVDNYDSYFKDLKSLGVNTIRTWATGENTPALLDAAHAHGMKVMVGIWMRHGRPGMEDDDSFDYLTDTQGKEDQYNNAIAVVNQYKDHPAVLTWGIGNEVYLNMATDEEKLVYSKLLERICSDIKAIDANHPITSIEAWTFGMDWWSKYVPSIDIYGLNSYGAGANFLAEEMQKRNIDKPYIVTEFGVTGEWDVTEDKNGVKIEPSDAEKYEAIANGYTNWINNKANCLGVYVFHYSDGKDFGGVWLMTHFRGKYRPQYWAVRKAFTGNDPLNYVPEITELQLTETPIDSKTWVPVTLSATDKENEDLEITFGYNHRVGSRRYRNQILALNQRGNATDGYEIELPEVNGAIKVYAFVTDTYANVGIASTSMKVKDSNAKPNKFRVPKVDLPFYVYKDNETIPYLPTGYMGNYKAMTVDLNHTKNVYSGNSAIEISYKDRSGWYGLSFVDPANDWGDILGGYDISGAKTFSFWAKADFSGIGAKIGFGLIGKDKPFPDSAIVAEEIVLTSKWKKYTIKLKKLDLSCIRSGLVIFSNGYGSSHKIYLDDIVFE